MKLNWIFVLSLMLGLIFSSVAQSQPASKPTGVITEQTWKQVQKNLTDKQIKQKLGEPTKTGAGQGYTTWYYSINGETRAVIFNGQKKVVGFGKPEG